MSSEQVTRNVEGLIVHPTNSRWDYSVDMRLHVKAKSLEEAVKKADYLASGITKRIPWAWLVVKRWKEPKKPTSRKRT